METSQDTENLLKECSAGVKMAISSIEDVMDYVTDEKLRDILQNSKKEHLLLETKIQDSILENRSDDKNPNPMAKGMSWMKVNMKIGMNDGNNDKTVADLITDGCNMGIKSLRKYLNQYPAAQDTIKKITHELIEIEDKLIKEMTVYL